ncbi:hypothetical protein F4810DRAFT_716793 [Camillea tinctor]|nr:hypothetical protein F4810DRAFT_716793 [Camillea tinctor]
MTDWKGIVKNGWHPEKEGTSLKGQVKGLLNRGDSSPESTRSNHSVAPITSLRDPSSFGPPPKRVNGSGPAPNGHVLPPPTSTSSQGGGPPLPSRRGPPDSSFPQHQRPVTATGPEDPALASKPFRLDTTGLSTSHLPPPPLRGGGPPRPSSSHPSSRPGAGPPPMLPPRLPPRNHHSPSLPPLGAPHQLAPDADGISGPGFSLSMSSSGGWGKRRTPPPPLPPLRATTPMLTASLTPSPTKATAHLGDLGVRSFSPHSQHLSAPSSSRPGSSASSRSRPGSSSSSRSRSPLSSSHNSPPNPNPNQPPGPQGTTWAQKQAALKTAADLHRDPASVSLADARAAASTANNFRQRHGDQVVAGARAAHSINERYGVADKMASTAASGHPNHHHHHSGSGGSQGSFSSSSPFAGMLAKKKKLPFPPPNKISDTGAEAVVPPVPLATRPRFG